MKVLVFGASGIIGQHMRLCVPTRVQTIWFRRKPDRMHLGCDMEDFSGLRNIIAGYRPDVVVNLAGESNTDTVEKAPEAYERINTLVPGELAKICDEQSAHLIHVSSQAVFSGDHPPYTCSSLLSPVNQYGIQKAHAETQVEQATNWTIVRPTFVLGVRPCPHLGRPNPVEQMLSGQTKQVNDRRFSPLFARDAAELIWRLVLSKPQGMRFHLGNQCTTNRYNIARELGIEAEPVSHDSFTGIAKRPVDTTYGPGSQSIATFKGGMAECLDGWRSRQALDRYERAREIALFLGIREEQAQAKMAQGFGQLHCSVSDDFRASSPKSDSDLLEWYRKTDSYIWELSAYHCDPGFNYAGMCTGIAGALASLGCKRVLVMGDGIGDLTITMRAAGIDAVYNDLARSRTADFAAFRCWLRTGEEIPTRLTEGWNPDIGQGWDAICSFDFLEHVANVSEWVSAVYAGLHTGGYFYAQNAFACGSGDKGSMPMHLSRNDRYEKDWDPLLTAVGFKQLRSNWYQKP